MRKLELPPWDDQNSWNQIRQYFEHTFASDTDFSDCRFLAASITTKLAQVDDTLHELCSITCSYCLEVCCYKATVWYDFRDLLFLYLVKGDIPDKQITRRTNSACVQLGQKGCKLKRLERPFICTWYICGRQHELLENRHQDSVDRNFLTHLSDIQANRKLLEGCFQKTVS